MRFTALFVLGVFLLVTNGCTKSEGLPDLKPASGVIRTSNSSTSLTGGLIEFRHASDPKKKSTSSVDGNGQFSLWTVEGSARMAGAHPGTYQVSYYYPVSFDMLTAADPVTIPREGVSDIEVVFNVSE